MELLQPSSADEAAAALGNGNVALAGGTELVPLLRDGLVHELGHVVTAGRRTGKWICPDAEPAAVIRSVVVGPKLLDRDQLEPAPLHSVRLPTRQRAP